MSELIDRQDVIDRLKKAEDVFRKNSAKLEANGIHYALELVESDIEIPTIELREERPKCEDCKFREGDCGHHHISYDGTTNYDIASLSACDRYGDCFFFKRMAESKGDLISREALKKKCAEEVKASNNSDFIPCPTWNKAMELIDNAPTVDTKMQYQIEVNGIPIEKLGLSSVTVEARSRGKWIFHKDYNERKYGCNQCGNLNNIPSNFCPECGAKMDLLDYKVINRGKCMMCGKELSEGLFFCKECEEKGRGNTNG